MSSHVLVFGCGPLPCEPDGAIMAPGARTWQIVRTVSSCFSSAEAQRLSVICLESATRPPFVARVGSMGATIYPLGIDDFTACEKGLRHLPRLQEDPPTAMVGCASIQPCATAVATARRLRVPVWADVFGDPIAEVQSAAPTSGQLSPEHESQLLHVWSLLQRTLVGADAFSTLSGPQRLALIGQLGCSGRLNSANAGRELVEVIPFGLWLDEFPTVPPMPSTPEFCVLWSGSFNTWTDPETLAEGMAIALLEEPRLHVEVLGGAIARYHEGGYSRFRRGLDRHLAPMERISLLDWQPYRSIPAAYARCHAALSLDRWTYEAVLGSRTRIVHMLAAGRPVVSTALSELTQDMAKSGVLVAVEAGNPRSLANGLLQLSRMNRTDLDHLSKRCRRVVEEQASAANHARAFRAWIVSPRFSADQTLSPTNALLPYWHEAIQIMTS